jgi:predicted DNA-binding ribbon-helix-helix protein
MSRPRPHRKSRVRRRTVVIAGNKTSVSLEDTFWQSLKEIAEERDMTLSKLITTVKSERRHGNLVGELILRECARPGRQHTAFDFGCCQNGFCDFLRHVPRPAVCGV